MATLTAGGIESFTGGILARGMRSTPVTGVSIDSRTTRPGDIFFAIRGPNNDGHAFIPAALERGAVGAVVVTDYTTEEQLPAGCVIVKVGDTHEALRDVAAEVRRQWRGTIVGVTGSMGKTTTKEFAAQILQTEFSVYRSPGNYNNLFGLPLALFGLSQDDHIGIFELGMSAPGEIAAMCRIARPSVGVVTNVAPVHLEFFDSVDGIARAKAELMESLPADGLFVFNADDPRVSAMARRYAGRSISFGLSESAQVRADAVELSGLGETRFRLHLAGMVRPAVIPVSGKHFVWNALPGVALALHYRLSPDQIVESLRHLRQAHMRGQAIRFAPGFTVIDDSYNSNPRALMQMIENLAQTTGFGRRIVVAGEMLELGRESGRLHYACGEWAARNGIDIVAGVQGSAREIARGAAGAGIPAERALYFPAADEAAEFLAGAVRDGDLVLVKGSRGVRLERVIQYLRAQFTEQGN